MRRIVSSANVSRIVPTLGEATPALTQRSYSNREWILNAHPQDQVAVHARVDPSRPDRIVQAVEKCEPLYTDVEMMLKNPDSLLQCPLTTIQVSDGWLRSTASTAKPVSIVHSGAAPSDFALNFVNHWNFHDRNYV